MKTTTMKTTTTKTTTTKKTTTKTIKLKTSTAKATPKKFAFFLSYLFRFFVGIDNTICRLLEVKFFLRMQDLV